MREMTRLLSNFVLEVKISYLGQTSGKNNPFLLIATRQPFEFNIETLSYFMSVQFLYVLRTWWSITLEMMRMKKVYIKKEEKEEEMIEEVAFFSVF